MTKHESEDAFYANCTRWQKATKPSTLIQVVCSRIHLMLRFQGTKDGYHPPIWGFHGYFKIIRAGFQCKSILNLAPCKGIRIPESSKFLLVEWGILDVGIQNTAQGIRNPLMIRIRNPSSTDNESGIHGIESRIQECLGFPYVGRLIVSNQFSSSFVRQRICRVPSM